MAAQLTPSQENYLEHILRLSQGEPVRVRAIAEAAGVRLPSVSRAIAKLAAGGFVRHPAYGSVEITPAGIHAARSVVRRDACLASLLIDVLGMDAVEAAAEVCRLEHVVGESVLTRLEILLEHVQAPASEVWRSELQKKLARLSRQQKRKPVAAHVGAANLHVSRGVKK